MFHSPSSEVKLCNIADENKKDDSFTKYSAQIYYLISYTEKLLNQKHLGHVAAQFNYGKVQEYCESILKIMLNTTQSN